MRYPVLRAISVGLLLATGACAVKTKTTDISPNISRNPTCENAVEVYNSRADVPNSYYELAWIEASGNSVWTTDTQMRTAMRKRAAAVGANGLIANDVSQNKTGVNVLGEAVGAKSATAKSSGLAIWMPAASDRTRLACGTSG
jgi:hypothetical protein